MGVEDPHAADRAHRLVFRPVDAHHLPGLRSAAQLDLFGSLGARQVAPIVTPDTWGGQILYSLAEHCGFDLDTPFEELPERVIDILFHGSRGEKFALVKPPEAREAKSKKRQEVAFDGIVIRIERTYRRYRQKGTASSQMEDYLRKIMVEHACPDCKGARLKCQPLLVTIYRPI